MSIWQKLTQCCTQIAKSILGLTGAFSGPFSFGGLIDSGPLPFARPGAALRALACPLGCPLTLGAMAWMDYVSLEIKENARCRKGIGRP